MNTVSSIIETFGGLEHLQSNPIRLTLYDRPPLEIEACGQLCDGGTLISVAYVYPDGKSKEIMFAVHVDANGVQSWSCLSWLNEQTDTHYEVMVEKEDGTVELDESMRKSITAVATLWDAHLAMSGYLNAARQLTCN